MTPFKAFYGHDPPHLLKGAMIPTNLEKVNVMTHDSDKMLHDLKGNLVKAQNQMKYADRAAIILSCCWWLGVSQVAAYGHHYHYLGRQMRSWVHVFMVLNYKTYWSSCFSVSPSTKVKSTYVSCLLCTKESPFSLSKSSASTTYVIERGGIASNTSCESRAEHYSQDCWSAYLVD